MSSLGQVDIDSLHRKHADLRKALARLDAFQERFIDDKADLIQKMSKAEKYLADKDSTLAVLERTLSIVQTQSKALFEELLTQLIHDIMPQNKDQVVLEAGVSRNRATLEFLSKNSSGFFENIYYDCGGSIHNIISVGLRFIVLSRTANRRILFLDEPDCWMNPRYVPTFMAIVESLAQRVGVQVIFISHYDTDYSKMAGQHIHLQNEDGVVTTQISYAADKVSDASAAEGIGDETHLNTLMDGVGWRYIRLTNVKSHENTLIELSPTMNYLSGDNNVGKSHVIRAVAAMLSNNGTESLIAHGKDEARLEIGIEEGLSLVWTYRRRGTRKTTYELFDSEGNLIKESRDGKDAPDWLNDYFAMAQVNGLDVHISDQNQSDFLIDRGTSTHDRAKALSLGRDAQKVQRMISLHGERCTESRKMLNEGQRDLRSVKNKLAVFRHNGSIQDCLDGAEKSLSEISKNTSRLQELGLSAAKLSKLSSQVRVLRSGESLLVPAVPEIKGEGDLERAITQIERKAKEKEALSYISGVSIADFPHQEPIFELGVLAARIASLREKTAVIRGVVNVIPELKCPDPSAKDSDLVIKTGTSLEEKRKRVELLKSALKEAIGVEEATLAEKEALVADHGYCPFCNAKYSPDGGRHEH